MALVCSIELNKERGATITVTDDQGKVTQTVHLDGTTLTLQVKTESAQSIIRQRDASIVSQVKKGAHTSKVTQTETLVKVECQDFQVDADTIQMSSKKDTTVSARGDASMSAQGDLTLKTAAKGQLQAGQSLQVKAGTQLACSGGQKASLTAPQTQVVGRMKAQVDGGSQLQLKALKVSAKGEAQLEVAAPITTVGQALTSVKGQLVKVEGALVKLG